MGPVIVIELGVFWVIPIMVHVQIVNPIPMFLKIRFDHDQVEISESCNLKLRSEIAACVSTPVGVNKSSVDTENLNIA